MEEGRYFKEDHRNEFQCSDCGFKSSVESKIFEHGVFHLLTKTNTNFSSSNNPILPRVNNEIIKEENICKMKNIPKIDYYTNSNVQMEIVQNSNKEISLATNINHVNKKIKLEDVDVDDIEIDYYLDKTSKIEKLNIENSLANDIHKKLQDVDNQSGKYFPLKRKYDFEEKDIQQTTNILNLAQIKSELKENFDKISEIEEKEKITLDENFDLSQDTQIEDSICPLRQCSLKNQSCHCTATYQNQSHEQVMQKCDGNNEYLYTPDTLVPITKHYLTSIDHPLLPEHETLIKGITGDKSISTPAIPMDQPQQPVQSTLGNEYTSNKSSRLIHMVQPQQAEMGTSFKRVKSDKLVTTMPVNQPWQPEQDSPVKANSSDKLATSIAIPIEQPWQPEKDTSLKGVDGDRLVTTMPMNQPWLSEQGISVKVEDIDISVTSTVPMDQPWQQEQDTSVKIEDVEIPATAIPKDQPRQPKQDTPAKGNNGDKFAKPTAREIATKFPDEENPKKQPLSVMDFDLCIFCQISHEEKLSVVTEDNISIIHSIILNLDCEPSNRLKGYSLGVDMIMDNYDFPKFHLKCFAKLKSKLKSFRKELKNAVVTNFSLCIFCQEKQLELLSGMSKKGFSGLIRDMTALGRKSIENLKKIFNLERIKCALNLESSKEEFSPDKLKYHQRCRKKFMETGHDYRKRKSSYFDTEKKETNPEEKSKKKM